MTLIRHWNPPPRALAAGGLDAFAAGLAQPSCLVLPGRDPDRCRVLVTLLHGNEPSGLTALHRLLREDFTPAVTARCYVLGVAEALQTPPFTHRQLPGRRDWNRCFRPPFDRDLQGLVCKALLDDIALLRPEAVVDLHNTSGAGPGFAVSTRFDRRHERLVSLFTRRLVVNDIRLGSLMETSTEDIPVVTIECGGAQEDSAHDLALEGLRRYFGEDELYGDGGTDDWDLDIYSRPLRVELESAATLDYAETPLATRDLTLKVDIEHHNFGLTPAGTLLGWLRDPARRLLKALDPQRQDHFDQFYEQRGGGLYTRVDQKMFMITPSPTIAKSDCLWYVVKAQAPRDPA